tara:strand:+ start:143 stop:418 length:276 start_codon:yes stop_codon:yes gene_type:complete
MKNGRPKLGYSNIHWIKLDKKKRTKPVLIEEEVLEEAVAIPLESLEDKMLRSIATEQTKALEDIFCPLDLTIHGEHAILLTSPTTMENTNE